MRGVRFYQHMWLALLVVTMPAYASQSTEDSLKDYSDTMRFALPAAGVGVTLLKRDWEGTRQWTRESLATLALTGLIKKATNKTSWGKRPDGGDKAFPSGHTSAACSGSAFLGKRYGWKYAAVTFPMAAVAGYSRVDTQKHHWRDVIGGCLLAYGMSELFVTKQGEEKLIPIVGPDFIGLRLHMPFTHPHVESQQPYQYYDDDYSDDPYSRYYQ